MFDKYPSHEVAPAQSEQHPGIIVLSMTGRVLHANRAAVGFLRLESRDSRGGAGEELLAAHLPPSLLEVTKRVSIQLEKRIAADEWTQFELKHVMRAAGREFLLRGFGLPDKSRRQQSRILLTLQPIIGSSAG